MNPFYRFVLILSVAVLLIAGGISKIKTTSAAANGSDGSTTDEFANEPQQTIVSGFDFSNLDRNANACQDFNQFANGGWGKKKTIPGPLFFLGGFLQHQEENN